MVDVVMVVVERIVEVPVLQQRVINVMTYRLTDSQQPSSCEGWK